MTSINASDLPHAVRKKLGITTRDAGGIKKRSRSGVGAGVRCAGSCAACGARFSKYTTFERAHSRPGHRRWLIDLDRHTDPQGEG